MPCRQLEAFNKIDLEWDRYQYTDYKNHTNFVQQTSLKSHINQENSYNSDHDQ